VAFTLLELALLLMVEPKAGGSRSKHVFVESIVVLLWQVLDALFCVVGDATNADSLSSPSAAAAAGGGVGGIEAQPWQQQRTGVFAAAAVASKGRTAVLLGPVLHLAPLLLHAVRQDSKRTGTAAATAATAADNKAASPDAAVSNTMGDFALLLLKLSAPEEGSGECALAVLK
jgi:hypothetical protein